VRSKIIVLLLLALSPACGAQANLHSSKPGSIVIASTTILADIVRNVAGDRLPVESILPVGADPHSYQSTPQDAVKIEKSKLLIINGARYEVFLDPLLENVSGGRMPIEASAGLPVERGDPHLWLDPNNVILYVENIRDALTHYDPDGAAVYKSNADAYSAQLKTLDTWISEQVSQIPPGKKLLISNHESLGYFARRYGFTIVGTVLESFSSDASSSAQQMAQLIEQIESSGAPAIFIDAGDNPALAQQIADETGAQVITDLHLESLTDGPPAATYIKMMKHNVTLIVGALK